MTTPAAGAEGNRFERRLEVGVSAEALFDWHTRPGAFARLAPPWQPMRIERDDGHVRDGARVVFRTRKFGLPIRWEARHRDYQAGRQFVDEQVRGPFAAWTHVHRVEPTQTGATLVDDLRWRLPMGALGQWVAGGAVAADLDRLFRWRHRVMADDLAAHARAGLEPMAIGLSGAGGLIGGAVSALLTTGGHVVVPMVRRAVEGRGHVAWPEAGHLDPAALEGLDAVIHLAGEPIAQRWTPAAKSRIRDSRVVRTRALAEAMAACRTPPKVLICASAVGWYGDTEGREVDETAPAADGFLARVCAEWEQATVPAVQAGVRVVNLRFGVVLSPDGGALAKMLPIFRMGLGGRIGDGRQWMSWIARDDAAGAILHALATPGLRGPVNAVAPNPVTNADFTRTLGRALGRPAFIPAPRFALKAAFGEMGQATVLEGQRVRPGRLLDSGYVFRYPALEGALRAMLGR